MFLILPKVTDEDLSQAARVLFKESPNLNYSLDDITQMYRACVNEDNFKTLMCPQVKGGQDCQKGDKCCLAHTTKELRRQGDPMTIEEIDLAVRFRISKRKKVKAKLDEMGEQKRLEQEE